MTRRYAPGITRAGIIFIFVALLLAGAVWAGIYFVQQRGEQVRREEAAKIAQQNLEEQSETPVISEEENGTENNGSNSGANADGSDAPDDEEQPAAPTTGTPPSDMPETGPEAVQLVALFALITSIAFFIASRKAVRQL